MAEMRNRRTAPSVQDVIGGTSGRSRAKFKSGYTGPKKAPAPGSVTSRPAGQTGTIGNIGTTAASGAGFTSRSGGILDYAWIAYSVILAVGLSTAIIAYSKTSVTNGIYYPQNIFTISGVVSDIFHDYKNGGLGSAASTNATANASDGAGEPVNEGTSDGASESANTDNSALLGESSASSAPNSTTGATMALDTGTAYGNYAMAQSHEELLEQLDTALSANDSGFVGTKLAYEDAATGNLIGYPQSVVEHFTQYMADNSDKRATFLSEIKDEGEFSAKNGSAYIVKLPLLQFTINMGYDGTTISISGFADQKMDSGQSAVVSPLLPCMYTIHAETASGSQTSEVECNINEGNLKINIGVSN